MRYNTNIQAVADQCAKDNDYLFASYLGRLDDFFVLHGDIFVFEACYSDNLPRTEGFPPIITVLNGEADLHIEPYNLEYYNQIRRYNHRKGRGIYMEYERKVAQGDFVSEEERHYITSIVDYQKTWGCYEKWVLYEFLEAADRLKMKLEFFSDVELSKHCYIDGFDSQELFIRLT